MLKTAAVTLLVALAASGASPAPQSVVTVDYAGSLVTPMEGPIAAALAARGITFQGEGKGSKALANLIAAGLSSPDVFISADASLVQTLAKKGLVADSTTFASASMVLGYSPKSPHRALFESVAAGKVSILDALRTPGLRIARTDPQLDPKGERTIRAMHLLGDPAAVEATLGPDNNPQQIFPEEDLLVRLDTGEADVGFLYSTEAIARGLPYIPLPGKASLSDEITYTSAIMTHALHPQAAKTFQDFILRGDGKSILEKAGLQYHAL